MEGTRKQVVWAETLRVEALTRLQTFIDTPGNIHLIILRLNYEALTPLELTEENLPPMLQEIVQYLIHEKVKAAYWINNRFNRELCNLEQLIPEYLEWCKWYRPEQTVSESDFIRSDSVLSPKNPQFPGIVEIKGNDEEISAFYEKMTGSAKLSGRWTTNGMAAAGSGGLPLTGAPSGIVPQSWEMYC